MKTQNKKTTKKKSKHSSPKSEITSNNIKLAREQKGWSQSELAIHSNTSSSHINRIESGERKQVSLPVAFRLSKALGWAIEDLFTCNV